MTQYATDHGAADAAFEISKDSTDDFAPPVTWNFE
jgi:hypothetical protein